nr:hypothetical protein [Rhodococcus erythropolis]
MTVIRLLWIVVAIIATALGVFVASWSILEITDCEYRALPAVGAVQSVDLGLFRVVGYSCSGGAGVAVLDSGRDAAALGRLGCCGIAAGDVGGGLLFGVHVVVAGVAVGRG